MKALKKLQLEATDIEAKFYEEVGVLVEAVSPTTAVSAARGL